MTALAIFFWLAVFLILWSYLGYPLFLKLSDRKATENDAIITELPKVDVIFAAYNEEVVIEDKIRSIFNTNYPLELIHVFIGSDASTDRTDEIIESLQGEYPNLHLIRMPGRTGKSGIINHLVSITSSEYILATDANIYFTPSMIHSMVEKMSQQDVTLVGGNIIYRECEKEGIAKEEELYLNLENKVKLHESNLWGATIGVEGGCYLIKRESFTTIPPLTYMEDFFITMSVLKRGEKAVFDAKAICTEDVSVDKHEEFKRKVRISLGNFQNLSRFKSMVFHSFFPIGFAFVSHKILRWFTPILLIIAFVCSGLLCWWEGNILYSIAFIGQILLLLLFVIDLSIPRKIKRSSLLRFVGHFYLMNFALFKGLIIYLQGVDSNVWQPTKRAQKRS